jgi:hypothetical protein
LLFIFRTFAEISRLFILQKIISYSLLILFSVAFSYETAIYFSKKINSKAVAQDYENDSKESDQSDDDDGKNDILEDMNCFTSCNFIIFSQHYNATFAEFIFSCSDYSQTIYSPPELIII